MPPEYAEFDPIALLLQRVRARWRLVRIWSGVFLYVAVLAGAGATVVGVECSMADSPAWLRQAMVSAVAAVAAMGFAAWVLLRMLQDRSDEEFALLVEMAFPEVQNGLINAVRLAKDDQVVSPSLVSAAMRETLRRMAPLEPLHAVDRRPLRRSAAGATAFVAVAACLVAFMPGRVANALQRLLRPGANLAKVGRVNILKVEPGDRVGKEALVAGETLIVTATIEPVGLREIEGVLLYREKGESQLKEQRLRMASETALKAELREVKTPLDYQVRVDDSSTRFFTVEVVEPPTITGIEVDYQYPSYTGEEPKVIKDSDGAVRGVVGTFFGMRIHTNRNLKKAWLRLDHSEEFPLTPSVGAKGAYLPNRLKIEKDRTYTIHIIDEGDYENREPVPRSIRALPDARPAVQIAQPGRDEAVAPGDRMGLVVRATDDYGFSKAGVVGRLRRNNEEGKETVIYQWPQLPEGKKIVLTWDWVFDKKSYQSGDVVRYYVQVEDNNNVSGPGVGKSSEFEVRVRDPEKVKQEQVEKYSNWQAELEKVLKDQIELRKQTQALEKMAGVSSAPTPEAKPEKKP
jgi:hypothetical protein